jgi:hypothetical protein
MPKRNSKGRFMKALKKVRHHMARRRSYTPRTTIVRAPAPVVRVSMPRMQRARHHARRAGRAAFGAVSSEKHTLAAVAAAVAFGLLEKSGVAIPSIGPLGPATTVGLGAWVYGRTTKNQMAQHIATGLLCVGLNNWARTGVISGDVLGTGVVYDDE